MFALRIPFRLPPTQNATDADGIVLGYPATIRTATPHIIVELREIPSEDEARRTLAAVFSHGLRWAIMNTGFGLVAEQKVVDRVALSKDPEDARQTLNKNYGLAIEHPVHGMANGNAPVIYRMDHNLRFVTCGDVGFSIGKPGSGLLAALDEGMQLECANDPEADLAVQIFASSRYEPSVGVRFLQLVTAMEVLLPEIPRPEFVQQVIAKLGVTINDARSDADAESSASLERLRQSVLGMTSESIGYRMREMVRSLLKSDPDVDQICRRVRDLYAKRSRLTHCGDDAPTGDENNELEAIVLRVLRARLLQRDTQSTPQQTDLPQLVPS